MTPAIFRRPGALALAGALCLAGAVGACAGAFPSPTTADATRAGTSLERLERARTRYIDKCSGCHGLVEPGRFGADEWRQQVGEMAERARLRDDDEALVSLYLTAFARPR